MLLGVWSHLRWEELEAVASTQQSHSGCSQGRWLPSQKVLPWCDLRNLITCVVQRHFFFMWHLLSTHLIGYRVLLEVVICQQKNENIGCCFFLIYNLKISDAITYDKSFVCVATAESVASIEQVLNNSHPIWVASSPNSKNVPPDCEAF